MSEPSTRDLLRSLGDAAVPVPDLDAAARARARAVPRIEAAIGSVAARSARRARVRRAGFVIGLAAALTMGVATAAILSRGARAPLPPPEPTTAPERAVPAPATQTGPATASGEAEAPAVELPAAAAADGAADRATRAATDAPASPSDAVRSSGARAASSSAPRAAASAAEPSTLAAQNRHLAAALDARRRGDDPRALALLDELLLRHPTSPLAQEARVERLRCLQRMGRRGAAADEARRYLTDYPDGFAREEAKGQALPTASARTPGP